MSHSKKEIKTTADTLKTEAQPETKQSLSLNKESKGFGTEEHITDVKKRQSEGGEVSADEERLLSQQV